MTQILNIIVRWRKKTPNYFNQFILICSRKSELNMVIGEENENKVAAVTPNERWTRQCKGADAFFLAFTGKASIP